MFLVTNGKIGYNAFKIKKKYNAIRRDQTVVNPLVPKNKAEPKDLPYSAGSRSPDDLPPGHQKNCQNRKKTRP